jgi:hypothetical protein
MLDECHDIVWCHTIFFFKDGAFGYDELQDPRARAQGGNGSAIKHSQTHPEGS